jgi:hypothetical protein
LLVSAGKHEDFWIVVQAFAQTISFYPTIVEMSSPSQQEVLQRLTAKCRASTTENSPTSLNTFLREALRL